MSQHHKFVYGSLFAFVAATHIGCAGSGLKNMFTRNETDGYHSLDELETEEQSVAETEVSGDEVEKPSIATRLASWRPFGKTEPTEEETSAAIDARTSDGDSEDTGKNPRFLGRAFTKRESVEPDPFLSEEPKLADRTASSSFKAESGKDVARIDDQLQKSEDKFAFEVGPKPKSAKDAIAGSRKGRHQSESTDIDTDAVALGASRKGDSSGSNSDEEDDALAKRFEQHFLLNSVGTVAKTETEAAVVANDLRQKVSTKAESKKRDISSIAERQINQFDFLLAADADSDGKASGFGRKADAEPLQSSKRTASTFEKTGNALAAFDQLMGTEGRVAAHDKTEVTNTAARSPKKKTSALDINVADAEALFGAAAARQNTRLPQSGTADRTDSANHQADNSSAWLQASENQEGLEQEDSPQEKPESQSGRHRGDVASAFASHLNGNSDNGKVRLRNAAFGAPPAFAGNVEDENYSSEEPSDIRQSNASTFPNDHRIVTANYGTAQPNIVRHSVGTETSTTGGAQFTAAPVAPVSESESVSEGASTAARPGLVQSFSTRNWLLLIGGAIVIALLFAPGRTKPLTMNRRAANG